MARKAKFKIFGSSTYHHKKETTIIIDRGTNIVQVRPKHFKKPYELRLQDVADYIIWTNIKAALIEKKKQKKLKRAV